MLAQQSDRPLYVFHANFWRASPFAAVGLVGLSFLFVSLTERQTAPTIIEPVVVSRSAIGSVPNQVRDAQASKSTIRAAQLLEFSDEGGALNWFAQNRDLVAGTVAEAAAAQATKSSAISSDGRLVIWLTNPVRRPLRAVLVEAHTDCETSRDGDSRWLAIWLPKSQSDGGAIPPHRDAVLFVPAPAESIEPGCTTVRQIYTDRPADQTSG
jgi:hypothetical protein